MYKITRQSALPVDSSTCSGHWTLKISVEAETEDADPNICVYQKSAAASADGKDTFYTVATLYDMSTVPAWDDKFKDDPSWFEQVPFYRTNEVILTCPNADSAEDIWMSFLRRVRKLVREYNSSARLRTIEEVSI